MRNLIAGLLTAGVVAFGAISPANAQYIDQSDISEWSEAHIEILTELGIVVGYPDGSFRPAQNITREELAVTLLNSIIVLEDRILDSVEATDADLYEQLAEQQIALIKALTAIDALQAEQLLQTNNFVAIGLIYDAGLESIVALDFNAKIQIFQISERLAISIRPWLATTLDAGASATLDLDITDDLEVFGGVGGAVLLTDLDDGVEGYGHVGVSYDISEQTVVILDGKIPFNGNDPIVGLSLGWKF